MSFNTLPMTFFKKRKLAMLLVCAPLVLTACGGSSSSSTGSSDSTTSTISGTASKGPIDSATVTAYALNSDGSRGQYLGTAITDAVGNFSLEVEHEGPATVVVTGGSYVDEASGQPVTLGQGVELETFLASVKESGRVGVTALTTIAASRAAANAAEGLATAIASANTEVSMSFGLAGADISMVPADLTVETGATASEDAQNYGLVQSGLSQLAMQSGMAPEELLTMVDELAEDFSDGRFDGMNAAGAALNFALEVTPEQALSGLQAAMTAFVNNPRNRSGADMGGMTVPEIGVEVIGQATKGPIADARVHVYELLTDGSRGNLLAVTKSDSAGNYTIRTTHAGPAAVVVSGGSYSDEATGTVVALNDAELETLVPDIATQGRVAVTALTTIASKRASANAEAGLAMAISAANAEVSATFGLDGVDIASTIPSDITSLDSAGDSVDAKNYGLVQSGLTKVAEAQNMAPEHVLDMIVDMSEDFADGKFDGLNAAGESIEFAVSITPEEALLGLDNAKNAFLNSDRNVSDMVGGPQ